jgi:hypothetical protein
MSTQFHHVNSIGEKNRISSLEDNLKDFMDWSFLQVGGFINVNIPTSGVKSSDFHTLVPVSEPSERSKVWEAPRKDWVYESGVSYSSTSPIEISGVYLNNTFLPAPSGTGNYTYRMNHSLGRIDFDNFISSRSKVQLEYSYRYIQTYKANESYWWKEFQFDTFDPSKIRTSGDYAITANHRIQLPSIMIETIPRTVMTPKEIGNSSNIILQDVLLHVFSQNINQRNNIVDMLLVQKDNTINLYDTNLVIKNNLYPLNRDGTINSNGLMYPDLSTSYAKYWCNIKNSTITELNNISSSLYNGIVRWSIEIFP